MAKRNARGSERESHFSVTKRKHRAGKHFHEWNRSLELEVVFLKIVFEGLSSCARNCHEYLWLHTRFIELYSRVQLSALTSLRLTFVALRNFHHRRSGFERRKNLLQTCRIIHSSMSYKKRLSLMNFLSRLGETISRFLQRLARRSCGSLSMSQQIDILWSNWITFLSSLSIQKTVARSQCSLLNLNARNFRNWHDKRY